MALPASCKGGLLPFAADPCCLNREENLPRVSCNRSKYYVSCWGKNAPWENVPGFRSRRGKPMCPFCENTLRFSPMFGEFVMPHRRTHRPILTALTAPLSVFSQGQSCPNTKHNIFKVTMYWGRAHLASWNSVTTSVQLRVRKSNTHGRIGRRHILQCTTEV